MLSTAAADGETKQYNKDEPVDIVAWQAHRTIHLLSKFADEISVFVANWENLTFC